MSRTYQRVIAVTAVSLLSLLAGPLVSPSLAEAPAAQAWWNAAHQGAQPPTPPDVPPDGLLVQGAGRASVPFVPGTPGLGGSPAANQAVTGLSFVVPPGAQIDRLVLKILGDPPDSSTVTACATTEPFEPVQNGPFADVPASDCAVTARPQLDPGAGTLTFFADMNALVKAGVLSFVLLPGDLDRLVFEKPGADALTLASGPPPGTTAGAFDPGPPAAFAPPPTGGEGGFDTTTPPSDGGFDAAGPPPLGDAGDASPLGADGLTPPDVAASESVPSPAFGGPRAGPSTVSEAAAGADPNSRTLLWLGLVAVGVAFASLNARRAGPTGAVAAPSSVPPQERGIGRFRQLRESRATPL